ncbi:MAG: sulfotransferase [bacterium]
MRSRRYAFVFVCQRGDLEVESMLLAASLKKNLRCRHELVACIHAPDVWGEPDPATLAFFQRLGVRTEVVRNVVDRDFINAVKISCLRVKAVAEKVIFLDSDVLCTAPFHDEPRFGVPLNLKPADLQEFTRSEDVWRAAYALAGVAFPDRQMPSTVSEAPGPPLFNSGFIAVERGVNLADAWQEIALKFRADPAMAKLVNASDQPSLAVAVHALGVPYDVLNERYDYPLHLRPLKDAPPPLFCRYHGPRIIRREPQVNALVHELASEHPGIASAMAALPDWAPLLRPYAVRPRRRWWPSSKPVSFEGPELAITGIPRSGSGHLCDLLRRFSNCLVINEPEDVTVSLAEDSVPWRMAAYYRDIRRRVLDGELVASTADGVARLPRVDAADFILGTRNTAALLPRLGAALHILPDARFIVVVRNPFDTVASWKGNALDPVDLCSFLEPADEEKQAHVAGVADLSERFARWWLFLAEIVLRRRDRVILVRYEDLVVHPMRELCRMLAGWRAGRPVERIRPSASRSRAELLDDSDREVIRAICGEAARELGVPVV